jgi:hypothetical protein
VLGEGEGAKLGDGCPKVRLSQDRLPISPSPSLPPSPSPSLSLVRGKEVNTFCTKLVNGFIYCTIS